MIEKITGHMTHARIRMHPIRLFRIRNTMIIANIISNLIGVSVVLFLTRHTVMPDYYFQNPAHLSLNLFFLPLSFILPLFIVRFYERPIRRYFNHVVVSAQDVHPGLSDRAMQRLLNEPFFLIGLNGAVWLTAAIVYAIHFYLLDMDTKTVVGAGSLNLQVGLVTITVSFFVAEFFLQRRLAPVFFPNGGLSSIPGTIRIRISTRLIAFFAAVNLIPMFSLIRSSWNIAGATADLAGSCSELQSAIASVAAIFVAVGIWLTFLISTNLTRPLAEITSVLQKIRNGNFDSRVKVTSNDELGYVGDTVNEMAAGLKEREFIRETFGKYVSDQVRDEILSRPIPLDGEIRDVTVLFADLRDFTPFVEKSSPQHVVGIINRYFEEMEKAVRVHRGLILQFIGDEIEAVFGAPLSSPDHATDAVLAAMAMNEGLQKVNRSLVEDGHPPLAHGIGIHSGSVVAANIGSPSRLSYALVGDTVNAASRLQDANKQHGTSIIISHETHRRLTREFPLQILPSTPIKGKIESISLYGV